MTLRSLLFCMIGAAALAVPAKALDLFSDPLPQSTGRTCQSYAAALALAAQNDPAFPIKTFAELREVETEFRQLAAAYGDPTAHKNWPKAMSDLTGGKYTFALDRNSTDIIEWIQRVRDATVIEGDIDVLIGQLSGQSFDMVLTSVTSIGGSSYDSGHIIAVMGVIGSGIDSTTRLVAFNSAIKGQGGTGVMCDGSFMVTQADLRYQAGVMNTNEYVLKGFPGYLFMRLVPN